MFNERGCHLIFFSWNVAVQCQSCLTVIFISFGRFEGCPYLIQWKVTTLIRWGSNFHFFSALYCSCLGLNAQNALPTKEPGNSKGKNKVLQRKQNYCPIQIRSRFAFVNTNKIQNGPIQSNGFKEGSSNYNSVKTNLFFF